MPKVNFDWVRAQLRGASVRQGPGDAAISLLKTWESVPLEGELAEDAVEIFSALALDHALIKTPANESWVQCVSGGQTRVGDVVRIKHNAYKSEAGVIHNGRVGKVTGIRSGDVIFRSTDGLEPFLDNTHHSFQALEKRVL